MELYNGGTQNAERRFQMWRRCLPYLDIELGAGKVRFQIGVGYETVYSDKF